MPTMTAIPIGAGGKSRSGPDEKNMQHADYGPRTAYLISCDLEFHVEGYAIGPRIAIDRSGKAELTKINSPGNVFLARQVLAPEGQTDILGDCLPSAPMAQI